MSELVIWRCPDCQTEIHQTIFGTPHTEGLACAECDMDMQTIEKSESSYDFEE